MNKQMTTKHDKNFYNINIATCFDIQRSSSGWRETFFKRNIQTVFAGNEI
jgi:hypothetical protein